MESTAAMTMKNSISKAMGENVNSQLTGRRMRRNSQRNRRRINLPKGTRSEMILSVRPKETNKQLEVAKQEVEEKESAKEARELAKRLEEQQQQQQNGLGKDGDGQNGCVGSGDSLIQELSQQNAQLQKELALAKPKRMEEQPNNKKQMKVQLPSENWFDLLAFVPRRKLAQIMAKNGNRQFAKIVQTFLHEYGQIKLDEIEIVRPFVEHPNGGPRLRVMQKRMDSWLRFKMADSPIPTNIKDFKTIKLSCYSKSNPSIVNFLRQFRENSLLENVTIGILGEGMRVFMKNILPLIVSISSIVIEMSQTRRFIQIYDNPNNTEQFSQMLKTKMAQTRIMEITIFCLNVGLRIGNTFSVFTDFDSYALCWCFRCLHMPRDDGTPRLLIITTISKRASFIVNRLKKDFLNGNHAVSFFVHISVSVNFQWQEDILK